MSHFDYERSKLLAQGDPPFYALLMAAMRKADTTNLMLLKQTWPEVYAELDARYNALGGLIPGDPQYEVGEVTA